jgi:hypothetical protein
MIDSDFELHALDILKEIVKSHDLQELKVGSTAPRGLKKHQKNDLVRFEDSEDDSYTGPIKDALQAEVPDFAVMRLAGVVDPVFDMHIW